MAKHSLAINEETHKIALLSFIFALYSVEGRAEHRVAEGVHAYIHAIHSLIVKLSKQASKHTF